MTTETEVNYMGGLSYKLNPLQSLQIVATSMICGESQYYRRSAKDTKVAIKFVDHFIFREFYEEETAENYFDKIVNDALDYDYEGCLKFVDVLRNDYFMRLNSNALLIKATHHEKRVEFNKTHPNVFKDTIGKVGCIPTDWTTQYRLLKDSGKPIPTIWKRAIAEKLTKMSAYHAAKYLHGSKSGDTKKGQDAQGSNAKGQDAKGSIAKKGPDAKKDSDAKKDQDAQEDPETTGVKRSSKANLIDLIRITHPKSSEVLTQLVQNGKVVVADDEQTWERLRSAKKTWQEINAQIRLPHMALLRNLRGIIDEYSERGEEAVEEIRELVEQLIAGVKYGKQFPFRYFSAYKSIKPDAEASSIKQQMTKIVEEGLDRCVLESVECVPQMKGRVDCLTDNSGSSRGTLTSEYGSVVVYEIANLSSILTAYRSTEGGSVWIFGDRLVEFPVSKTKSILKQLEEVNDIGSTIGGGTETGVWLFWQKCIAEKKHLDTVFIYSDMQAGTGQLYVSTAELANLKQMGSFQGSSYVDVLKLVNIYRKHNNPKTNVFSVQVAGYNNSILPDILYRGAVLSGWTGKEAKLAYEMNSLWDSIEA